MSLEANLNYPMHVASVNPVETAFQRQKSPAELKREAFLRDRADIEFAESILESGLGTDQPLCLPERLRQHFFGPDGESVAARNKREQVAIAICVICPLRESCLETSLKDQYPFGVWGGLGEKGRENLLKRINAPVRSHSYR